MKAVRVGLTPTPCSTTREPGISPAATSQNAAALKSPGMSMSSGSRRVVGSTCTRSPSTTMAAPIAWSISSVWSLRLDRLDDRVVPSANSAAMRIADFTCALGYAIV